MRDTRTASFASDYDVQAFTALVDSLNCVIVWAKLRDDWQLRKGG